MLSVATLIGIIAALVTLSIALSGCGSSQSTDLSKATPLVMVLGNHQNAPAPGLEVQTKGLLTSALRANFNITVISVEGNPRTTVSEQVNLASAGTQREKEAAGVTAHYFANCVKQAAAKSPEVDTLAALSRAAHSLPQDGSAADLVICDSGLSTKGLLDFREPGEINADATEVVAYLKQQNALPDFSKTKVTITWVGLGETAGAQASLNDAQYNNLEAIYRAILVASGVKADKLTFMAGGVAQASEKGLPPVTVIDFPAVAPVPAGVPKQVFFDDSSIRFKGERTVPIAEYADPTAVIAALKPWAQKLVDNPGLRVHIIGTTASYPDKQFIRKLSENRAKAVAVTLEGLGVPVAQITSEGQGMGDRWHIDDLDARGRQIPAKASQNRKVVLLFSGTLRLSA